MIYRIAVVLLVLWLLGILAGYTRGGFINILLALAIIMVFIDVSKKRKRSVQKTANQITRTGNSV